MLQVRFINRDRCHTRGNSFSRIERRRVNKLHIIPAFDVTPAALKLNVTFPLILSYLPPMGNN